jgi:hypothetical protein
MESQFHLTFLETFTSLLRILVDFLQKSFGVLPNSHWMSRQILVHWRCPKCWVWCEFSIKGIVSWDIWLYLRSIWYHCKSLPQRKSYDAIHSLPKERHPPSHHKSLCIPRRKCHIFMIENAPHMPANSIATNHSSCTIPCHQTPRKLFIPTDARQIRTNDNTKHERKLITQNSDNFRHGAAGYAGCF